MVTPKVVAEALGLDDHYPSDEKIVNDWIKEYLTKIEVQTMGKAMC